MYPRLQLLKELLRDDGAIFVSIDDNEVHHLRMLMDEIFGEENFVADVIWQHSVQPKGYTGKFSQSHNHTVIYSSSEKFSLGVFERTEEHNKNYSNPDDDPKGPWRAGDVRNALYRPNLIYNLKTPSGKVIKPPPNGWRWSKETMQAKIASGEIVFSDDESRITRKIYLSTVEGRTPETLWLGKDVGSTREAAEEMKEIFGNADFQTAKPTRFVRRILEIATDEDSIILDSFAGSGTTAHAVLELNKEDGGNRKFILVQQPFDTKENEKEKFNISEKITRERVLRVARGYSYKTSSGKMEKVEGLGGEFAYARVGGKLMGEYRNLGDKLPAYEQVARYVYFTETSQNFDANKMDEATGKIGEWQETSYYLLYSPDKKEARALDMEFLETLKDKNVRKVIYCEKVWVHREDLGKFGDVRPMLVPFNLK
jgi:adenine-specific DNA-methyltransferase